MKTALVIIDLINDLVHPNGKFAKSAENVEKYGVIDATNRLIAKARQKQVPVIHVKVGFSPNYDECPAHNPASLLHLAKEMNALQLDSWGTEFHEGLDIKPEDLIVIKRRVSPFYKTELELILRNLNVKRVVISGVSASLAIQSATRESHDRDFHTVVATDACADHLNASEMEINFKLLEEISELKNVDSIQF